jgi:PST family polysaccharide transporter
VEPIIRFLSLTFLITAFSTVPHALLARKLDFRSIFLVSLSSSICSDLTRLIMALMGFGVWSLVSSQIVSSFVGTIGALWVTRFWMAPNFKLKSIIEELRFGLQIVAKGILAYFNRQIDVIIIGKFLGSIALGSYSVAVRLSRFPARFALRPISGVSLSAFARIGGQPDKVRKYFLQMVEHLLLIFFPVCWAVSAFAEEMVLTVFGVKWALAIPVLHIVVLIAPIRALYRLLLPILDALGRPKVGLLNQTTTVLCLIPSIFLGVRWGLIGVSVAWVCAHLCAAIINLRRSLPFLNVLPRDLITVLWRTVFASTMMYMSIIGGKFLLPNEASVQLRLIELIGIGTIVYGGLILSINRAVIIRMVRLILNSDRDSSA